MSEAEHLVVLAPPGCGKTEVLAMRASRLLRNQVVRPSHRLFAITFTNRARDNLRNRLVNQLGEAKLRESVTVVNFHEFSARVIEAHQSSIGLDSEFTFPRPSWQRNALDEITSSRSEQATAKRHLEALKREPLSDEELLDCLRASGDVVALALEIRRQREKHLDYGDLQRLAQLILRNERIAALFQAHYDAVFVDEFQDLSLQQYELTKLVCARNSTYVGDPSQGIFGWAGAQPEEVFEDLGAHADEIINLDVSFRSSPAVLKVVNTVSASLGATALHAASPDEWQDGGYAFAVGYDSDAEEATAIVSLCEYLAQEYPKDTIGVICQARYRRSALNHAFENGTCQPRFWDIALDAPQVVRLLRAHVPHVSLNESFAEQLEDLRDRVIDSLNQTDIETLMHVNDACDQLLDHEHDGLSVPQLVDRLREDRSTTEIVPGVHVLNAHVGKGQQFDWVVVMGLEEGHVPSVYSKTSEAVLEDQRVLLVMLSRARKGVFLTRAGSTTNQYGRVFTNKRSRWWDGMSTACGPLSESFERVLKT